MPQENTWAARRVSVSNSLPAAGSLDLQTLQGARRERRGPRDARTGGARCSGGARDARGAQLVLRSEEFLGEARREAVH